MKGRANMDNRFDKYNKLVERVAKDIYESVVDVCEPYQYDNDLLKDISQDVWLELLTIQKADPDITDKEIEKHLEKSMFSVASLPDQNIIYYNPV